jgi:transcriptional regulator with XRE-family HTH domain
LTSNRPRPRRRQSGPPNLRPNHARLVQALFDARLRAGLTGGQLAERCGWSQAKISKFETGKVVPPPTDVAAFLTGCNVPEDEHQPLLDLAELVATDSTPWEDVNQDGFAQQQQDRQERESDSMAILIYQPLLIPGLLQIDEYIRQILLRIGIPEAEVDQAVAARAGRQAVLNDRSKSIEIVIAERALRWRPGPAVVTIAQLEHLKSLVAGSKPALRHVSIGIVSDQDSETAGPAPMFELKRFEDGAEVQVETLTREHTFTGPEDVALYEETFAEQRSLAVYGQRAVAIIDRSIEYLRALS